MIFRGIPVNQEIEIQHVEWSYSDLSLVLLTLIFALYTTLDSRILAMITAIIMTATHRRLLDTMNRKSTQSSVSNRDLFSHLARASRLGIGQL